MGKIVRLKTEEEKDQYTVKFGSSVELPFNVEGFAAALLVQMEKMEEEEEEEEEEGE